MSKSLFKAVINSPFFGTPIEDQIAFQELRLRALEWLIEHDRFDHYLNHYQGGEPGQSVFVLNDRDTALLLKLVLA